MLEKVKEKLERRFHVLPLHHINTDVILEPHDTENGRACARYLQLVGYKYRGKLSFPVLSEIFLKFLLVGMREKREIIIEIMDNLREKRKIDYYSPKRIGRLMEEISKIDKRLEPTDIQVIASAIEDGAINLVTIDTKLIGHKSIEEKYELKIVHPKNFI